MCTPLEQSESIYQKQLAVGGTCVICNFYKISNGRWLRKLEEPGLVGDRVSSVLVHSSIHLDCSNHTMADTALQLALEVCVFLKGLVLHYCTIY